LFSPSRRLIWIAVLCSVLFMAGLTRLFLLRFEAGNVYPPYSSLRTDPLGTRALFESLNRLNAGSASRNHRPLDQISFDTNTTLMIIGLGDDASFWDRKTVDTLLQNLARSGGRLVLAFTPSSRTRPASHEGKAAQEDDQAEDKPKNQDPIEEFVEEEQQDDEPCLCDEGDLPFGMAALGFRFRRDWDEPMEDMAVRFYGQPDFLPRAIPWRSPVAFELRDNSWETIFTWQEQPVVVQRPWGRGTVAMSTDSYLLSNEALRNHRFAGLLAWLVGPGQNAIFDEFHQGLVRQPGMAALARQYRLHGVFAALLAVAMLFIWRQSAVFVPVVRSELEPGHAPPAAGRDTSQGLVHLARQHIDTKGVLTVCFQAWKIQAGQRVSLSRIGEVDNMVQQAVADARKEVQVQTYKEICELLKRGKRP